MPDKFSKEVRSKIMRSIKSKNTKIELTVFRELRKRKVYFQRHHKGTPGSPDICIPSKKIAVFIDGDFWHGYRFKRWKDKLGTDFWRVKIQNNMKRDQRNFRKLRRMGWRTMRVWEHQLEREGEKSISKIFVFLKTRDA
jgi:DNA mismatch endonuclease (patch repair protein)